jgi:hypothetical protein
MAIIDSLPHGTAANRSENTAGGGRGEPCRGTLSLGSLRSTEVVAEAPAVDESSRLGKGLEHL